MSDEKQFAVYILTNTHHSVLYTGVTNNLVRRVWEHKTNAVPGFTSKYRCHELVWYELTSDPTAAISREKQIKAGSRGRKIRIIEEVNPDWEDLSAGWYDSDE